LSSWNKVFVGWSLYGTPWAICLYFHSYSIAWTVLDRELARVLDTGRVH